MAPGVTEIEASEADDDDDQAAAQDGQTSDDDGEEASGNAIKVTHDTPRGSKGDGADQLIKTFGILAAAAFGADFSARSHLAHVPRGFAVLRAALQPSDLRYLRGADPLRVIVTIALIELSKAVAKPLHFFAIADLCWQVQQAASTP